MRQMSAERTKENKSYAEPKTIFGGGGLNSLNAANANGCVAGVGWPRSRHPLAFASGAGWKRHAYGRLRRDACGTVGAQFGERAGKSHSSQVPQTFRVGGQ